MENAIKRQRRRHGIHRPGPAARESAARLADDKRIACQNAARVRKANQRAHER